MGKKSQKRDSEIFRRKCRQLMVDGVSVSEISKITGKPYKHTKQICAQEDKQIQAEEAYKEMMGREIY